MREKRKLLTRIIYALGIAFLAGAVFYLYYITAGFNSFVNLMPDHEQAHIFGLICCLALLSFTVARARQWFDQLDKALETREKIMELLDEQIEGVKHLTELQRAELDIKKKQNVALVFELVETGCEPDPWKKKERPRC